VGVFGYDEDSYTRFRLSPKLDVTGRLEGSFRGRPVQIEAERREISIRVPNLRSAWMLRRAVTASTIPLLQAVRDVGLTLTLHIDSRWAFPVLPKPHVALRLIMPSLQSSE
jgi:hypothetical protein